MYDVPEIWYKGTMDLPQNKEYSNRDKHQWLVLDGAILQEHIGLTLSRDKLLIKVVMGTTAHAGTPPQYLLPNATLNETQVRTILDASFIRTLGSNVTNEAIR